MTDQLHDNESIDIPEDDRGAFGMRLFLLALTVLFAASMVGYVVIRTRLGDVVDVQLPVSFWWSTIVIVASGIALSRAERNARAGQSSQLRVSLVLSLGLSLIFLAIQVPAVMKLLAAHASFRDQDIYLYRFAFSLIVLHGLHVIGGMIPLIIVTIRTLHDPDYYSPNHYAPVRYVSMYWHFLEGIWVVMFGMLLLLG